MVWGPPTPVADQLTITGYRASAYTSLSGTTVAGSCQVNDPEAVTCTISGLEDGATYWFSVLARAGSVNGTPSTRIEYTLIGDAPPTVAFVQISAGANHACGITEGGEAWCWGSNEYGQLGLGSDDTNDFATPQQVALTLPTGVEVEQISAGYDFTCALTTDDDLFCWGADDSQQLGDGDIDTVVAWGPGLVAAPVNGAVDWTQVSAGFQHACARSTGNVLYCWGSNADGQLGIGSMQGVDVSQPTPVDVSDVLAAIPDTFSWVSAGSDHSCAIAAPVPADSTTGTAWCWGDDIVGQLGNGANPDSQMLSPSLVASTPSGGYTQVAAGDSFTCAVADDGDGWCWGQEMAGELGDGGSAETISPVPVAVDMPSGIEFQSVDTDYVHACARSTTGVAYCWGDDAYGAVGISSNDQLQDPSVIVPTPVDTAGTLPDTYLRVDAGSDFTCAIATGGRVWCWGDNVDGQLGGGTVGGESDVPQQAVEPGTQPPPEPLSTEAAAATGVAVLALGSAWGIGSGRLTRRRRTPRRATDEDVAADRGDG